MSGTSVPWGSVTKPMNGGFGVTPGAEAYEVKPRRGQRHERIGPRIPGNTGPRRRILRVRKSSESRPSVGFSDPTDGGNGQEDKGCRKAALATAGGNPLKTAEAHGRRRHETRPAGQRAE